MTSEAQKNFYKSVAWKNLRAAYAKQKGFLCERCLAKGLFNHGDIVHHKVYLNADNLEIPEVTLGTENLELLCQDCHNAEHFRNRPRYTIDEFGNVKAR